MTHSDARTSALRKSFAAFNAGVLMFSLITMSFPVDVLAQVISPDVVTTPTAPDKVVDPVPPVTQGDTPATTQTPNTDPTGDTHETDPTPPTPETKPTVNGQVTNPTPPVNPVCPAGTTAPTPPVGYDAVEHGPFTYGVNDCVSPSTPAVIDVPSPTCTIVSDTDTQVTGKGAAKILSYIHSAWATITGASWIWGDNPVTDTTVNETQVFTRTFNLSTVPTSASIEVAVDNAVVLKVNGTVVNDPDHDNFSPTHTYSVGSYLHTGTNTIEATATNVATPEDSDPTHNPAGLIYKLVIDGSECSNTEQPPVVHTATVKICKADDHGAHLSGWQVMLLGDKVATKTVSPDGNDYTVSNVAAGSYVVKASGEYVYRPGDAMASTSDAAYSLRLPSDGAIYAGAYLPWVRENDFPMPNTGWLGIMLNNSFTDFGSVFNPAHIYALGTTTTSTQNFSFKILDDQYADNSGSLSVDLYKGYTGITAGEDGCVTFNDVPYGPYSVDEIQKAGWTNVSGLRDVSVDSANETYTIVNSDGTGTEEPPVGTCEAGVNLINNGGFEAPTVTTSEGWNVYASGSTGLSWLATWIGGVTSFGGDTRPETAQVEIQKNGLAAGWLASEGNQWAEIDTDWVGPTSAVTGEPAAINLYQDIATVPGKTYTVAFDYSARPDAVANENVIEASHGGVLGVIAGPLAGTGVTNWLPQTYSFVATTSSTRIAFRDAGTPDDSLGAFIDNVHVTCQPTEPEPTNQCVLGSDTTTLEGGSPSSVVTSINARWTAFIDGFSWIWGEDPTTDTETGKTETFSKTFWLDTTAASSTLQIAADNAYTVTLNGTPIGADAEEFNYGAPNDYGPGSGQDVITINPVLLVAGANTLVFTVNNFPMAGGTSDTNPGGLRYKLMIDGATCTENPPAQETLKVHVFKYLQTENSTAQVPNDSTAPAFPMTATWSATNIGAGTAGYVLGNYHGQPTLKYAADTSAMSAPANYTTSETTDGSVVLPIGSTCQADKYRLVGYKSGVTLAAAQTDSIHATAPTYTGLTSDRYVIVVNEKCATDGGNPTDPTNTASTVVVHQADLAASPVEGLTKWFFYNDTVTATNSDGVEGINNSLGSFVTGPAGAGLLGTGSAEITVSTDKRRNLATYQFHDTKLADIKTLKYSTFNPSAGNGALATANRSAYLQFNVSFDGTDTWQRRLTYVPANNTAAISQNNWKEWDAISAGTAQWTYSGATWPVTGEAGTTPKTWAQILTDYPNAQLRATDSFMGLRVGEPYADGYTEDMDKFVIGIKTGSNIHTTTFDFEPTAITTNPVDVVVRAADLATDAVAAYVSNSSDWFFYKDNPNPEGLDNARGSFVPGPATAPLGDGSAQITVDGTTGVLLDTFGYKGTRLDKITTLQYSTYKSAGDPAVQFALQFDIDNDVTDANVAYKGRLVYEPYHTQTVSTGSWQTWDAMNDAAGTGTGNWWFSSYAPGQAVCPQSNPCTLAEVKAAFPNAGISGGLDFKAGTWATGFTGNVDKFVMGVLNGSINTVTTYNFEPDAVSETPDDGDQTPADTTGSRNSRSRSGGSVLGNSTEGEVLGASCGILIDTFMSANKQNDSADVNDLKSFLNGEMGTDLSVDGMFDSLTTAAVNAFQVKYWQDVLNPWVPYGLATNHTPTGYVYKTTAWKINMINCPELNLPQPQLP